MRPRPHQRHANLLVLLLLAVVVTACSPFGFHRLVVPSPEGPEDEGVSEPPNTDLSKTTLRGNIVFADTDLALRADLSIGDHKTSTLDGTFAVELAPGTYAYELTTLLGTVTGELVHVMESPTGDSTDNGLHLAVPAFDGWSPSYFNALLIGSYMTHTMRWPFGTTVPVWIQSSADNPHVTTDAADKAWSAFREWETMLGDALTFKRVNTRAEAEDDGIAVLFDTQANVSKRYNGDKNSGVIGLCEVWYRTGPARGELVRGTIWLAYNHQESLALHRHESGHCIGLGHSPDQEDIMYAFLNDASKSISPREQRMIQLLYSIRVGATRLNVRMTPFSTANGPPPLHIDNADGTARRIIPTHAESTYTEPAHNK